MTKLYKRFINASRRIRNTEEDVKDLQKKLAILDDNYISMCVLLFLFAVCIMALSAHSVNVLSRVQEIKRVCMCCASASGIGGIGGIGSIGSIFNNGTCPAI